MGGTGMKKRSAVLIAAGLVLAMVTAAFGIMMGFTGPSSAGIGGIHVRSARRAPIVRTVTQRRTIHRTAPGGSGSFTAVAPTTAPSTSSGDTPEDTSIDLSNDGSAEASETETPEPTEIESESPSPGQEPSDD